MDNLLHYSPREFELIKDYYQHRVGLGKPTGFWVSVGEEWKEWCEGEGFRLEGLKHVYEVTLKCVKDILFIDSPRALREFTLTYREMHRDLAYIDWSEVQSKYKGIIIAPYLYECRLDIEDFWYYGWDCASGCIWDLDLIELIYK